MSKTEKIITTGIGAGSLTTNFIFYDAKTPQDNFIKAGISFGCVLFAAIPLISKSKRINVNSSGINIDLKFKKYKCKNGKNVKKIRTTSRNY